MQSYRFKIKHPRVIIQIVIDTVVTFLDANGLVKYIVFRRGIEASDSGRLITVIDYTT